MAVDYPGTVFPRIGKLIAKSNSYAALASTTLSADLAAILTVYGTGSTGLGDAQGPVSGLSNSYAGFQAAVASWRQQLAPYVDATLTDYDTVLSQLSGLSNTDIRNVLKAIIQDMIDQAQAIKASTITIGSVTAASANVGNGTALVDGTLDGYNAPLRNGFAHIRYNGLLSQLCVPAETMVLTCTADSFSGGVEGGEQWSWTGGQSYPFGDYHPEGSGQGPGLTTANNDPTLQNLGFQNFSVANTPDSWTIVAGAAGTDIFKETTNVFRGTSALRFAGAGSVMPAIQQAVPVSLLRPRRRHLFTIRAMKGGSAPGAGNLTIKFTGTGYTASSSEKIDIALTTLGSSYGSTVYKFWLNTPSQLPADFALSIAVTGANLASGANVYLDSGSFSPVPYHGGISAAVLAGSVPWCVGDRLSWVLTNNQAGKFADYFRRAESCQLPSATGGLETINDAGAA